MFFIMHRIPLNIVITIKKLYTQTIIYYTTVLKEKYKNCKF